MKNEAFERWKTLNHDHERPLTRPERIKAEAACFKLTGGVAVVKRYANRKLSYQGYYISHGHLKELIAKGESLQVIDTRTDLDVTKQLLVRILSDLQRTDLEAMDAKSLTDEIRERLK